jgi:hypothetical protein
LNQLHLRIDAGSSAITESVPYDLGEMQHEPIVVLELVMLEAQDRPVIRDSNKQVTAFCIEKCRNGLKHSMRNDFVILPALFEIPSEASLELQGLGFLLLQKLISLSVTAQVLVKEEVLNGLSKSPIICDPFIKREVCIDDILNRIFHFLFKGQPNILTRVDPRTGIEARIAV